MSKVNFEDMPQLMATMLEKIERLEGAIVFLSNQTVTKAPEDSLYTIDEAAIYLKLSKHTLYGLVSKSKIPVNKRGKRLYFRKSELEQWIAEGRLKSTQELAASAATYMLGKYTNSKKH